MIHNKNIENTVVMSCLMRKKCLLEKARQWWQIQCTVPVEASELFSGLSLQLLKLLHNCEDHAFSLLFFTRSSWLHSLLEKYAAEK